MPTPKDSRFLQACINYDFRDAELLKEALTHPSYVAENPRTKRQNQRLEFLGDAVIQILMTTRLFQDHPEEQEGNLTKLRAVVTRQQYLSELASQIELGSYLRLGNGEAAAGGDSRRSNLCDAFEALIGALYLDSGGLSVPATVLANLLKNAPPPKQALAVDNPKGRLQEYAQSTMHVRPNYEVVDERGPDHKKIFVISVSLQGKVLGTGEAGRRQEAEQAAALAALQVIFPDETP